MKEQDKFPVFDAREVVSFETKLVKQAAINLREGQVIQLEARRRQRKIKIVK